ncbi:Hpt domain-containing protein [Polaribacter litorisediminis]|uniref:Hpt domain-containing protein n=1 Tax=Polaribacter litorisediminis TaxID=1908341 RepID=UPI001CBE4E8C|nr:Hpt domain-containing protein [Polaribacter litorisediminis]UAM99335.1 Hpt domain-containing protein [Polaribacter litorisediminis]
MEHPNIEYINKLARGDEAIRKMLIDVVKSEFPEEKKEYLQSFSNRDFKKIEENVHKLKHKISILGLEKSYDLAKIYEHNLREKSIVGSKDFEKTLGTITKFIETL